MNSTVPSGEKRKNIENIADNVNAGIIRDIDADGIRTALPVAATQF